MAQTKQLVISQLKPIFKQHGYKFIPGQYASFCKREGEHIYSVGFSMGTKYQIMNGGNISIADLRVERIILDIGLPNIDLAEYREGKHQLFTVSDTSEKAISMSGNSLDNEEKAMRFVQVVATYLNEQGWAFAQHYSYILNILAHMNRLEVEGKYWNGLYGQGGILVGGSDSFFRGLIISKLCNDSDFERKLESVDELFYKASNQWLPYYEQLKTRLALI